MRFDNAYLTTSSCSPSRCSIITGRYPHNTGAELHVVLPDAQIRFPELLREAGYYTVLSGKNHMFSNEDRAFDKITDGGGPGRGRLGGTRAKSSQGQAVLLLVSILRCSSRLVNQRRGSHYDPNDVVILPYMVDTPITREDLASYYHEVSRYDHYIGLVAAELERQGVLENTMIVVAADNGRPFPRAKSRLYDSGIKTPWVVHYPDVIETPSVSKSLISVIDLATTCLELAGRPNAKGNPRPELRSDIEEP